mmetsp:Transcript_28217/g.34358  ORF Transcript_28217/g.34358 Transcript_28217/m.34358 type:complete len:249 (-) Transcript_28217:208-954(-)
MYNILLTTLILMKAMMSLSSYIAPEGFEDSCHTASDQVNCIIVANTDAGIASAIKAGNGPPYMDLTKSEVPWLMVGVNTNCANVTVLMNDKHIDVVEPDVSYTIGGDGISSGIGTGDIGDIGELELPAQIEKKPKRNKNKGKKEKENMDEPSRHKMNEDKPNNGKTNMDNLNGDKPNRGKPNKDRQIKDKPKNDRENKKKPSNGEQKKERKNKDRQKKNIPNQNKAVGNGNNTRKKDTKLRGRDRSRS